MLIFGILKDFHNRAIQSHSDNLSYKISVLIRKLYCSGFCTMVIRHDLHMYSKYINICTHLLDFQKSLGKHESL